MDLLEILLSFLPSRPVTVEVDTWILEDHKVGNGLIAVARSVIEEEKPPPEEPGQQKQGAEHREASGRNGPAGVSMDKGDAAGQAAGDESGQQAVTAHDDAGGTGERSGGDEGE